MATFRRRIYQYYEALRRKYGCRLLPVAVYLRVGLDGIGIDTYVETYDDMEVLRFQFLYVGLGASLRQYDIAHSRTGSYSTAEELVGSPLVGAGAVFFITENRLCAVE